ncbi:unnamed protein product [Notodromas monacha]|uniref:Uncharacterized protein n=1 Tax=Notodromas monacha TaxID=399045 RepID=A0A7R9GC59_9CRUS|nr:unnamed protein product [Notodromas monacha]CAG0915637.1 unnamed protein product [Notodromas monacha]
MVREVGDRGSCLPVEEAMNDSLPAEAVAEEPVELILSPDDSDSDSMVDKGDVENVKFLLNLGANASRKDAQGRTAFHIACGAGRSSVMKELVARDELVDPELRKARRVEYSQAAKSCLDEVVERAVETLIDGGPFVIPSKIDDKIRKEIVCELPELTGAFQPCGDLRIQNPILKPPVAPGRYISGGMLDIGEQLCRPELGLSFLAGGKTRLKDLLTVTEEDLDDLGIRKIGDRIAYLELPCIALRTDFSGKYLEGRIDRYKSPYGQESIEYLSVALSKAPMDLGKRRKVYSDYVRQAVASTCLPLLEADTRCVALWCSVMAAHHVVASRALKTMQEFEKVDEDKLRMLRQLAKTFATDLNAVMETVEETRFILKRELRINPLIKQVDKLKPRTKRWARLQLRTAEDMWIILSLSKITFGIYFVTFGPRIQERRSRWIILLVFVGDESLWDFRLCGKHFTRDGKLKVDESAGAVDIHEYKLPRKRVMIAEPIHRSKHAKTSAGHFFRHC